MTYRYRFINRHRFLTVTAMWKHDIITIVNQSNTFHLHTYFPFDPNVIVKTFCSRGIGGFRVITVAIITLRWRSVNRNFSRLFSPLIESLMRLAYPSLYIHTFSIYRYSPAPFTLYKFLGSWWPFSITMRCFRKHVFHLFRALLFRHRCTD